MIKTLTPDQVIEKLWCGTVNSFDHDMVDHSLEFRITVLESCRESNYKVVFLHISQLEIFYENPETAWNYVELTEININKDTNFYNIICDFWSTGGMKLKCKKIIVNGIEVKK